MARTKQEIITEIQETFVQNSALQQLYGIDGTNAFTDEFSLVSLEAQLIEVFGTEAKVLEDLYDLHLQEVDQRLAEMTPGTLLWYQKQALNFQYGYNLTWNAQKLCYEYATIDESRKIIKLASVTELDGTLLIKVAKVNGNNEPIPLTTAELTAFTTYMQQVKYAGVLLNCLSREADQLRLFLKIYYNPMLLNSNGSLLENENVFPVRDAVKEYLKLLPFNGLFNVTDLIDALQKVQGVENPLFINAQATLSNGTNPVDIVDYYRPNAGYLKIYQPSHLNIEYKLLQ